MAGHEPESRGRLSQKPHRQREEGLTGIPGRVHCPATADGGDCGEYHVSDLAELDQIALEHFLNTLVEVAFSVAARRAARKQQGGEVG